MRFDIITIFPEPFEAYFNESILRRAKEKKLIDIRIWNLRDFAEAPKSIGGRQQIDDRPFGGGPGMVIKVEPLVQALEKILKRRVTPLNPPYSKGDKQKDAPLKVREAVGVMIILLDAGGKQFDSKTADVFAKKYKHIIFICGRYEGVDERIKNIVKAYGIRLIALSVGPYVLTGGELPAMLMVDAISRHIPGVLGKAESLEEKRHGVGVPVYTRPEVFEWPPASAEASARRRKKYSVPKVLLSGNHKNIEEWRKTHQKKKEA